MQDWFFGQEHEAIRSACHGFSFSYGITIHATSGDRPINPASVETYLRSKLGDNLDGVRDAMVELAGA